RPGAWPKAPADNVPTSGDKKATPTPAPPGAWPTVRRPAQKEVPQSLKAVREFWPNILEALKERRRFAWIIVDQNAKVADFDGERLSLEFASKRSLDTFHAANLNEALEYVVREVYKFPWVIDTVERKSNNPAPMVAQKNHRPGQWPITTENSANSVMSLGVTGTESAQSGKLDEVRRPGAWPTVARFDPALALSNAHRWPEVLEEIRVRRRFAWILLSQNAKVVHFDDSSLHLEFVSQSTVSNYHSSGVHEVLESTLRDMYKRPYVVHAIAQSSNK
ncbi:hypothetical protein ACH4N1_06370, partial [Streptomyces sp. NPDC017202]